ncbi:MAG: tellurite resistance/C4-dicarboxylate transporter family protein [Solirubrobacteraceae bacterium]
MLRSLHHTLERVPAASGAAVMATGIVSVALTLDGQTTLARILLAIAALEWIALGLVVAILFARHPTSVVRRVRSPAALSAVADTAVLATGLTTVGPTWAAIVLLAIAVTLWLVLIEQVLAHLRARATGVALMVTVATESLAVLAAAIATQAHASWLVAASLVPLLVGLGLYCFVIARFDFAELTRGRGDQWIAGGALAIATLAAARASASAQQLHTLGAIAQPLRTTSVVLWVLALTWLAPLLAGELAHPRLRYHLSRWSTVFPLGMYAACSFAVGTLTRVSAISEFAETWVWVALCAWAAVSAGIVHRGVRLGAGHFHAARRADLHPPRRPADDLHPTPAAGSVIDSGHAGRHALS